MDSNHTLTQYGILATNVQKASTQGAKIDISNAFVEKIDFKILQEKNIKELKIIDSKIENIDFIEENTIQITFAKCVFKNKVDCKSQTFLKIVDFSNSTFQCGVNFEKAIFTSKTIFDNVKFEAIVNFSETQFKNIANFNLAEFCVQQDDDFINFIGAVFTKKVDFGNTKFNSEANFSYSTFNNKADFCNAAFNSQVDFSYSKFEYESDFSRTQFLAPQNTENYIENLFEAVTFKKEVEFDSAIFNARVSFSKSNFENNVFFVHTKFSAQECVDLMENNFANIAFKKEVSFDGAVFESKTDFSCLSSENKIYFINVYFKNKVNFEFSTFLNNAYFDNSIFGDYAYFYGCEFEKTASFYEVKFNKAPNFCQAIFKGSLNIVNANLNFDFENLQTQIKEEHKCFNKNQEEQYKKSLGKFANDFRDSFRLLKNALIKDGNLLDASNFHKVELYCKEIELKQSWNSKDNKVENKQDLAKNAWSFQKLIDSLLLGFYRKLCNHHTDFLKVFNNLILLIALYAMFVFIGFHKSNLQDTKVTLALFDLLDNFEFYINIGVSVCMVLGGVLTLYKLNKNSKWIHLLLNSIKDFNCIYFLRKWKREIIKKEVLTKTWTNIKIVTQDTWILMESLIFALFFTCSLYIILVVFGTFLGLDKHFGYSLLINISFVSLYICLVYTKSLFWGRYVIIVASYAVFFIVLIENPSIIHPLIGKIANNSLEMSNDSSLIVLNISYTMLIGLVLFSLQKTARKNSIVPS